MMLLEHAANCDNIAIAKLHYCVNYNKSELQYKYDNTGILYWNNNIKPELIYVGQENDSTNVVKQYW